MCLCDVLGVLTGLQRSRTTAFGARGFESFMFHTLGPMHGLRSHDLGSALEGFGGSPTWVTPREGPGPDLITGSLNQRKFQVGSFPIYYCFLCQPSLCEPPDARLPASTMGS